MPRVESLPGEVGPPTLLLEDGDRQLQPVLGFTYEDFIQLFRDGRVANATAVRPSYVIDRVDVVGGEMSQRTELDVELAITVTTSEWVRIPLRLARTIIKESRYDGPGDFRLHVQDNEAGETSYVGWLRTGSLNAANEATGRLHLRLLAPLTISGADARFKLALPRATTSQIRIALPGERVGYRVSDGAPVIQSQRTESGATELVLGGTGGDVEVVWRSTDAVSESDDAVLEAAGTQFVRIDGRSIHTEAKLSVRSFGKAFDEFQVRLPAGAELISVGQSGTQVSVSDNASGASTLIGSRIVDVKLEKKTVGPVELRLATERLHRTSGDARIAEPIELCGFEVLGAVRQYGHVAVMVVGNWQVNWTGMRQINRTDDLPTSLRRDDLTAGFEYFANPYSLAAEIAPQRTRLRIQPDHTFRISANAIELETKLKCNVRGSKLRFLDIELAGWEVSDVSPSRIVAEELPEPENGMVTIPLAPDIANDFELQIVARRPLAAGADSVVIDLPRPSVQKTPQASLNLLPANVVIIPAENVELQPREIESKGLSRQLLSAANRAPQGRRDPLSYRCESGSGTFAASLRVRPQEIRSQVGSLVSIDNADIAVEQTIDFHIANDAANKLTLDVPRAIPLDKFVVVGETGATSPLALRVVDQDPSSPQIRVEIPLATAKLGRVKLQVRYPWRVERSAPTSTVSVDIPLAMPADSEVMQNQLLVTANAGVKVTPRPGGWRADDRSRGTAVPIGGLALMASDRRSEVSLSLQYVERQLSGTTQVEQTWIQTRLSDSVRQDRAVYRIVSNDQQLRLSLPDDVVEKDTSFSLNGKIVQPLRSSGAEWIIPLPGSGLAQSYLLEIRYRFRNRAPVGFIRLQAPTFADAIWQRHVYWQVIAPALEHLVWGADGFTSESSWKWRGGVWRRQPALEQDDLENLLGVASAAPPVTGANRYLFSSVGVVKSLELRTIRRTSLVLFASIAVLSAALALIYWPAVRHPVFLIAAATALIAVSLMNPEASLLVAQSSSLGGLLGIVGYVLARVTFRRRAVTIGRGSSYVAERGGGSQFSQRVSPALSPTTTATPLLQGSSRKQDL